ncbi:hypothetical protein OPQ81_002001 [Rhizoctonia solani]|nr:hypothetical protein OPQ81_002001 [Rhizoctonia solani]
MDKKMDEYVHQSFAGVWRSSSRMQSGRGLNREAIRTLGLSQVSWCIVSLSDWIENSFARLALEVLSRAEKASTKSKVVSLADVQQWKEIGIGRIAAPEDLGALRYRAEVAGEQGSAR